MKKAPAPECSAGFQYTPQDALPLSTGPGGGSANNNMLLQTYFKPSLGKHLHFKFLLVKI
jgi:hypothetical protein